MTTAHDPDRESDKLARAPGERWRAGAAGVALVAALASAAASADDTEIFFGQVDNVTSGDPNVLFVLDTSGSMGRTDGTGQTRLERMKDALYRIVEKSDDVNVGLMRFQGHYGGSSVIFPMTPITGDYCDHEDCDDIEAVARVRSNWDDTEEQANYAGRSNGGPPNNILTMDSSQRVGFRFPDLNVPQGATITSAVMEFTAHDGSNKGSPRFTVYAHDLDDAAPFAQVDRSLADRPRTAGVEWKPQKWKKDKRYTSVDLSSAVQEVVSRSGWCGGNAISFEVRHLSGGKKRQAWSYEYASGQANATAAGGDPNAPTDAQTYDLANSGAAVDGAASLRVTYSPGSVPASGGCTVRNSLAQIAESHHDAEQRPDGSMYLGSSDLELPRDNSEDQHVGLHFENAGIPEGVEILDARIEFQIDEYNKDREPVSLWVDVEDAVSAQAYDVGSVRDDEERPLTGDPVAWNDLPLPDEDGDKLRTPSLASLLQTLVDKDDWSAQSPVNVQLWRKDGRGRRTVESVDGDANAAPKLIVRYRAPSGTAGSGADTSVKTALNREILAIGAAGGTPIVDALYEAAQYYRGGTVEYGRSRGFHFDYNGTRYDYRTTENRVSAERSWTGGTIERSAECASNYPDGEACLEETITGSPRYVSPMNASCQTNHVVLLTDGSATSTRAGDYVRGLNGIDGCDSEAPWAEQCGLELSEWLYETDHVSTMPEKQNVTVHTIGFALEGNDDAVDFVKGIAQVGGGGFYEASSADELVKAFDRIVGAAQAVDTSFVAPGATVNQFNRLTHRNDIYFALFKPEVRPTWNGNLKRYKLGADTDGGVAILDFNDRDAVDDSTGFFDDDATSWWSSRDGARVADGGAAARLAERGASERRLYTFVGPDSDHAGSANVALGDATKLHEDNGDITRAMLGLSAGVSDEERAALLKRARGLDVDDLDGDGDTGEQIGRIGDPMHSRPVIVNYDDPSTTAANDALTTVFLGTNEGFLHAIERKNGDELWAFMPKELLPNLKRFAANDASQRHPYGLDGSLSVWIDDKDNDNIVDTGESAYLYIGMRRGGSSYYAFDVSDRTNPKLAWAIHGGADGTEGFEELGQSWSRPVPTEIMVDGARRQVVIFGAGYATTQDPDYAAEDRTRREDTIGRGFYIVDAKTGAPVQAVLATKPDGRAWARKRAAMKHSVPGDIRVIDVDFDDLADQLWFADTGGRVWRFDFTPYHKSGDSRPLVKGNVVAQLGGADYEDNRRFYYEPDVSLVGTEGERFLSISVGSGWRAHPLNTVVQDRFYVLRSNAVYNAPEGYGMKDGDVWRPITDDDLTDVTNDLTPVVGRQGWFMDLETKGEKVLGDSITVNNQVVFTSYLPKTDLGNCESDIGTGRVYAVSVFDGSPAIEKVDEDGNPLEETKDDRFEELVHGGIPPEPAALITENGPTILVGPEQPLDLDFNNLTQRSYWRDNGRQKPIVVSDGDGAEDGEGAGGGRGGTGGDEVN